MALEVVKLVPLDFFGGLEVQKGWWLFDLGCGRGGLDGVQAVTWKSRGFLLDGLSYRWLLDGSPPLASNWTG